ncbi:hypothetical protein BC826DRAFT_1003347 [Russula brevipes]|nr:hypothetical protein BC826DRAFT_1003347 [Russula brevipes]
MSPPAVLTIAGSDSGGGAGIQADLKTFTALGCYGTSVLTALTAQNTKGVQAVQAVPPSFVEQQLESVLSDINVVAALKARPSLLPSLVMDPVCVSTSGHALLEPDAIGTFVSELLPLAAVLTPNTSEAALLLQHEHHHTPRDTAEEAEVHVPQGSSTLRNMLPGSLWSLGSRAAPFRSLHLSRGSLQLTAAPQHQRHPSTGEANAAWQITSIKDMLRASRELCAMGPKAVLLKGGHLARGKMRLADVEAVAAAENLRLECDALVSPDANMEILFRAAAASEKPAELNGPVIVDVLCEADDLEGGEGEGRCTLFVRPFLESKTLACALARGEPRTCEAVKFATLYTHYGIATAFPVGSGHGPLNHMHPLLSRVLPRATPGDPYPLVRTLIRSNADVWKQYVQHDFVRELGKGTLSRERFIHFLKQDYLYLKYYARANGLLAAKCTTYDKFQSAAETILGVVDEHRMHIAFCAQWGVTLAELESTPESPACTAYGAYMMDAGQHGDAASIVMSLAACLLGYGQVGLWLQHEAQRPNSWVKIKNNPYRKWIEDYSGESYQAAVKVGLERLEALAVHDPPSSKKLEQWTKIWGRCTLLEKGFWDMAVDLS